MPPNAPTSDLTLETCRQRYVENMAALYRRDPDLAARLDRLPFAELPELESTRDGNATVRLLADDGKPIYAHSKYRPAEEATKLLDGLNEDAAPTFVVSGPGLGYVLVALNERFHDPLLIVCEDDLCLLKASLCLHDLSRSIDDGHMIVLWSTDKSAINEKLMKANADFLLGLHYVTPPHARRYHADFHREMSRLLLDFTATARTQIVTLLRTSRVTLQNVANNTAAYLAQPGIEALAGRGRGYPAIVVAAGPSLLRNLDQLGALRARAVIISVQTVFKLLLSAEVEPHFVTSLDFHEVSAEFFRGVEDVGRCALVAEPKATWHVPDSFPGRRYLLHHAAYETLLGDAAAPHGGLKPGTTVAHLAFYLAEHLGCDPIMFVGQDLAYSEGLFYLPGSPIESIWAPEMGRFQTIEMKQWERIVRNRPILRTTRDVNGAEVYTDDLLFTYSEQFEADFAVCGSQVIQASEGGVALRGATAIPLKEAARRYCGKPLPDDLFDVDWPRPDAREARAVGDAFETRIDELCAIREIATEMRGLLIKLEGLTEKPREFNHTLVRVDELRTVIKRYEKIYRLVVSVSSSGELRRHSADRQMGKVAQETSGTARQRLKRDRDFVDEFVAGCDFLQKVLPEAQARLRDQLL
jgi:hypothetical protein